MLNKTQSVNKMQLTAQTAQTALAQHANANSITAQQVQTLLANKSVQFANIVYCTKVATSAKHKSVNIVKVVSANVQLFANITAQNLYVQQVQRSANNISTNNSANVQNFVAQSNYFTHTNCYSLVTHKTSNAFYLYAIYNSANSVYFINNVVATKQQVAQYLTASAAAQLLQKDNTVHNVTNNVTHSVKVRTIALQNIVSITANKQQLVV
jgi:hypothetical protein